MFRQITLRENKRVLQKIVWIFIAAASILGCDQYQLQSISEAELASLGKSNCNFIRNSKGQIVSWKKQVPVSFRFSERVPVEWRSVIKKAADAWVSASGTKLIQISDTTSGLTVPSNDRRNIIYWIEDGVLSRFQQGQTVTRWRDSVIQDADVLINAKDFTFYADSDDELGKVHLESLLVHEFGHALGLKHTNNVISVMYPELAFFQIRIEFAPQDNQTLHCEYL